jgi:hypothetical protein
MVGSNPRKIAPHDKHLLPPEMVRGENVIEPYQRLRGAKGRHRPMIVFRTLRIAHSRRRQLVGQTPGQGVEIPTKQHRLRLSQTADPVTTQQRAHLQNAFPRSQAQVGGDDVYRSSRDRDPNPDG